MPTKWLQERADGSKNGHGIGFEGPGVESLTTRWRQSHTRKPSSLPAFCPFRQLTICTEWGSVIDPCEPRESTSEHFFETTQYTYGRCQVMNSPIPGGLDRVPKLTDEYHEPRVITQ